jgi:hypothetical protein
MLRPISIQILTIVASLNAYVYAEWNEPINLGTTVFAVLTFFFLLHEG